MQDKPDGSHDGNGGSSGTAAPVAARRGPHARSADMRDTVAELAERAQLIKLEAGSKVSAAMKDVISAAAGIAGFAIESARDLVQYMVRRGQMTPEEGDKLIQQAESAHAKRPASERNRPTASKIAAEKAAAAKAEAAARAAQMGTPRPLFGARPAAAKSPAVNNGKAAEASAAKVVGKAAKTAPTSASAKKPTSAKKPSPPKKAAAMKKSPVKKAAPAKGKAAKSSSKKARR